MKFLLFFVISLSAFGACGALAPNPITGILDCTGSGSGGAAAFSAITAGTNTAALLIGSGGSIAPTGTGTITANYSSVICSDVGGLHLNTDPATGAFTCGTSTGSFPKASLSWNAGTIADGTCSANTFTLLNAALGDPVVPGLPVLTAGLFATMFVSDVDTITVQVCNLSGVAQAPGVKIYTGMIIK